MNPVIDGRTLNEMYTVQRNTSNKILKNRQKLNHFIKINKIKRQVLCKKEIRMYKCKKVIRKTPLESLKICHLHTKLHRVF